MCLLIGLSVWSKRRRLHALARFPFSRSLQPFLLERAVEELDLELSHELSLLLILLLGLGWESCLILIPRSF